MTLPRTIRHILAPFSLAFLAGCQSVAPVQQAATKPAIASAAGPVQADAANAVQANRQGAPVAVFLASRQIQPGWTPVPAPSGTLYVNPKPFLNRTDLRDVKAGGTDQGQGWLVLGLNPSGQQKLIDATTTHPNKNLALVIGRTMMPLLSYAAPITDGQLIFYVSNQENAVAAARAIAGVQAQAQPAGAPAQPKMGD
ncbi:MAG: hypothetical protein KA735_04570 [Burkholderiaceae bacterium]|nr:hypothetical protein [Burkholderiaceae bacterium]